MISKSSKALLADYKNFTEEKSAYLKTFFKYILSKQKLNDEDLCKLINTIEDGEEVMKSVSFWRETHLSDFLEEKKKLKRKQILVFIQRNDAMKKELKLYEEMIKKLDEKWRSLEAFPS